MGPEWEDKWIELGYEDDPNAYGDNGYGEGSGLAYVVLTIDAPPQPSPFRLQRKKTCLCPKAWRHGICTKHLFQYRVSANFNSTTVL